MGATRFRFMTIARPIRVVDGDTIKASMFDLGRGHHQYAPSDDPYDLRLVGPDGRWFDAAEKTGRYAEPEGKIAAAMLKDMLAPVIEDERLRLAFETFPTPTGKGVRDSFGRWLYYPVGIVTPHDGWRMDPWDPIGHLVAAGVATIGGRFPRK